jgi:DNA modification methylase
MTREQAFTAHWASGEGDMTTGTPPARGGAVVLRGDAAQLPMPDASADLIVTSPPYWGLRDYRDGGGSLEGQIGSEETPGEYLASLWECTAEWARVLKPGGSIFVNLGDAYSKRADGGAGRTWRADGADALQGSRNTTGFARRKSLLGLPWRYAIGCTDELGLILRRDIIWHKTNGMPESVTDRCRTSHEYLFHFVKQPRYYSAVDEIREAHSATGLARAGRSRFAPGFSQAGTGSPDTLDLDPHQACNPLGKLPGSVWDVPSAPLIVPAHLAPDHFAAYPPELCRRIILGWSPPGICLECGEGRRPVVTASQMRPGPQGNGASLRNGNARLRGQGRTSCLGTNDRAAVSITGYACACTPYSDHPGTGERHRNGNHPSGGNAGANVNAGTRLSNLGASRRVGPWREYHHLSGWDAPSTRPALVVDPFGGTGTTALVADVLGRAGITIDRSADYCSLATWRTTDPGERARTLGVPKPPPVPDGQRSLFDDMEAS